jgi:hypothetical protein
MALLTLIDAHRIIVVPADSLVERDRTVEGQPGRHDVVILPQDKHLPVDPETNLPAKPKLHMAQSKSLGVIYAVVLILIIVVSNVPLRGLWSVITILMILLAVLVLALTDRWEWLVERFAQLDIRISLGGYVFISTILFIIWAITVFIFDHRTYVAITPGQVRVCLAVGAGETVYDTTGMTFQKQQNDLFRHWIVGLGSGDLIIHRTNTTQEIDMPNVLFIGAKVKEIEQLIKERQVV